jgi:ABC-type multidrug transport system fused ATPase/permease subunit
VWVSCSVLHVQVLAASCEVAYPWLAARALEAALQALQAATAGQHATLWQALSHPPAALMPVLFLMLLSAVGETVFATGRAVCASMITVSTLRRIRSTVFAALLQQEKLWFQHKGRDAAALAARITSDCEAVAKIVSINFNVALRFGVQTLGALGFLAYINPYIAAYCAASAVLMSYMSLKCALSTCALGSLCV